MSLIAMAVYDTEENGRSEYTERTLKSLSQTVDWSKHRLVVIDNDSCETTKILLSTLEFISQPQFAGNFGFKINGIEVITLPENIGTAKAINKAIAMHREGEAVIKIDNDCVIHRSGWVEEMEAVIEREPSIGIVGLKRKDLRQTPYDPDPNYRSELVQLPHKSGQDWLQVEITNDIMGTCTMLSSALLDTIGGMAQPSLYGWDDTLMSLRSRLAGFNNCFIPHIPISHIDTGDNGYVQVKHKQSGDTWQEYQQWHTEYCNGTRPLYYDIAND